MYSLFIHWLNRQFKYICESFFKTLVLNFGPQHPASHGVLRLVLQLQFELVEKIEAHIGFLHRGSEKLMEYLNLSQAVVFLDRLDYTSVITQGHAFCIAVESTNFYIKCNYITNSFRTIFDELSRILNHIFAIVTHALDIGTMSPLFWAFEERELIMELCEYITGARMHTAMYIPFENLITVLSSDFILKLLFFLKNSNKAFSEIYIALYNNRIWKLRLCSVGILNYNQVLVYGITGPIARSTGYKIDLRLNYINSYANYWFISFYSFFGITGDCYDRFLIRSRELLESISIIYQSLYFIKGAFFEVDCDVFNYFFKTRASNNKIESKMENLITNFKKSCENYLINTGAFYGSVEAGKGEFGVTLILLSNKKTQRVHLRSPAYNHLQLIHTLGIGHMLADIVTLVGTLDVVFGEVDR